MWWVRVLDALLRVAIQLAYAPLPILFGGLASIGTVGTLAFVTLHAARRGTLARAP